MNKNRTFGALPIYKIDQLQDWQLEGYYYNWKLCLQYVPRDILVSFRTPPIEGNKTAPTQITIRKLKIKGSVKTVVSSDVYNVTMYEETFLDETTQTYYYFIQSAISDTPTEYLDAGCVYDIYIKDADGNEFVSNIFVAIDETEVYIYSESEGPLEAEDGQYVVFE